MKFDDERIRVRSGERCLFGRASVGGPSVGRDRPSFSGKSSANCAPLGPSSALPSSRILQRALSDKSALIGPCPGRPRPPAFGLT